MEQTQKIKTEITETDSSSVPSVEEEGADDEDELTDGQQSPAKRARQHKCTICSDEFNSLPDCLKHELLVHSNEKNGPAKTLRSKVNAILKTLRESDNQTIRTELREALEKCNVGEEMAKICEVRCMDADNLQMIYQRIHACLEDELSSLKQIQIYPFGSIATGLALKDSDIDLHMRHIGPPAFSRKRVYNTVCRLLQHSQYFTKVIPVRMARVPIIKCDHIPTGFSLDINVSCSNSVHNTNFVRDVLQLDPRLHELMLFLKIWAKQLQIIGRGSMTCYCLIMLAIFYLQIESLLPSVCELQSYMIPVLVDGINYAYSLGAASEAITTSRLPLRELIKRFFDYYADFDFSEFMVVPHLGKKIALKPFKSGAFIYTAYEKQMQMLNKRNTIMGKKAGIEPLKIDSPMCVQDPFILNCNVARSISQPGLEYFSQCVQQAKEICRTHARATDAQLYKALLCGAVEQLLDGAAKPGLGVPLATANSKANKVTAPQNNNNNSNNNPNNIQPNELKHHLTPCRAEMRAINTHHHIKQKGARPHESMETYQLWLKHYREAIRTIISEIYCLEIQPVTPKHWNKEEQLDDEWQQDTEAWHISGSLDLWTGRLHQRSTNQTFMAYQRAQTIAFIRERRQNADYAVQMNGLLSLNVRCNGTALELVLTPKDDNEAGMTKKNPLRKFFMMLKFSVQSFNLKEKLNMERANADDTNTHSLT